MLNNEETVAIISARLRGLTYQQVQQSFGRKLRKPNRTIEISDFLLTSARVQEVCSVRNVLADRRLLRRHGAYSASN
jgi:hypothetical protein